MFYCENLEANQSVAKDESTGRYEGVDDQMNSIPKWKELVVVGVVAFKVHLFNLDRFIQGVRDVELTVRDLTVEDQDMQVNQEKSDYYELFD